MVKQQKCSVCEKMKILEPTICYNCFCMLAENGQRLKSIKIHEKEKDFLKKRINTLNKEIKNLEKESKKFYFKWGSKLLW